MTPHLFVYGTLRRDPDHGMHRVLARAARFVAEGAIHGRLFDLGEYPGALPEDGEPSEVRGEAYELLEPEAAFVILDAYEGCAGDDPEPHEFERRLTEVELDSGGRLLAWVYWYAGSLKNAEFIESGDYLRPL